MKHFQEILLTLGASATQLIKEHEDWDLWRADYKTPVSTVSGHYLYLKHKCPLKAANPASLSDWRALTGEVGYEVIVTPLSPLAGNLDQTNSAFRGKQSRTSKQLLLDSFLKEFSWKPLAEEEEYFIDPSVEQESGKTTHDATKFLISWFGGRINTEKNSPIAILTANGGVGKTTVSRILASRIRRFDPSAIPILVESEQWRHLLQSNITLETLWDLAISSCFENAGRLLTNETALRVLVREGLFVVVFDGFDELCLNQSSSFRPKDVIGELIQLLTPEDEDGHARILLTARETYWSSVKDEIDLSRIELFKLNGFDNDQRKRYFANRLENPAERDTAFRISSQISGGIYEGFKSDGPNEERFSGIPFILDLIARYVHENSDAEVNPYVSDPFEDLLTGICRRESRRQSLDLEPQLQFMLFEELFREYETFSIDELKVYLGVICGVSDSGVISRFTNHVFLNRVDAGRFAPRYDVLKVYFVARFLASGLADLSRKTERSKIAKLLASNSTGKTQIMDWLTDQVRRMEDRSKIAAIAHARDIIFDKENSEVQRQSSMALFHLVNNLLDKSDKRDRVARLAEFYAAEVLPSGWRFSQIALAGGVRGFDFSGCEFIRSSTADAEFRNCIFDADTSFKNCSFDGTLSFTNSRGEEDIQIVECSTSKEAEYVLDTIRRTGSRSELKRAFAEDALVRALKKFRRNFGFGSIQYRHRKTGFKPGNPYNETIWEELQRAGVIERHAISNVEEGGLNFADNKELRKEVGAFLDNGVLGPILKGLVARLID